MSYGIFGTQQTTTAPANFYMIIIHDDIKTNAKACTGDFDNQASKSTQLNTQTTILQCFPGK